MTRRKLRPARVARRGPLVPPPAFPVPAVRRSRLLGTTSVQPASVQPADHDAVRQTLLPPDVALPAPALLAAVTPAPAAGAPAGWESMTTDAPPQPDKADVAILIVDDDPRNLFAVRETLEDMGAQLVLA
ncbi:MAG: hypothetical protein ACLGJC_21365, partial [Alphaproteobacteria bacterium]